MTKNNEIADHLLAIAHLLPNENGMAELPPELLVYVANELSRLTNYVGE
jgi:hypothetical protein